MAAALCLALSSCVEKAPVYVPGEVATGNQAFFKATESKTADIPLTGSYKVKVNRFDSTASATVNIKSSSDAIFTVPSSVSFDAGKGTAELTVSYNVNSLTPDQTYKLALRLASDTTAYAPSFCNVNLYCNPWRGRERCGIHKCLHNMVCGKSSRCPKRALCAPWYNYGLRIRPAML